mgnify:CR=1 FL=1
MKWLDRNASAIGAAGAILTSLVALVALIAIPMQIRATAVLQADQSARDIYREFVALSVSNPQFAAPDYCALIKDEQRATAYSYYVEYMLYTAEQVTTADEAWLPVMQSHFDQHQAFFCANREWHGDAAPVAVLIAAQRDRCEAAPSC